MKRIILTVLAAAILAMTASAQMKVEAAIDFSPENENIIEEMTDKLALAEAISKLDTRSQQIIKLRFYRDLSQQQTAEILGITQVKVSREEKKIFEFLRKQF